MKLDDLKVAKGIDIDQTQLNVSMKKNVQPDTILKIIDAKMRCDAAVIDCMGDPLKVLENVSILL